MEAVKPFNIHFRDLSDHSAARPLLVGPTVISVIHDNAANVTSAGGKLREEFGIANENCIIHTLNLIVDDAMVSYNDLIALQREVIGKIKMSASLKESLRRQCEVEGIAFRMPKMASKTRFMGNFDMFVRF